jgi:hypothetical protein
MFIVTFEGEFSLTTFRSAGAPGFLLSFRIYKHAAPLERKPLVAG